MDVYDRTPVNGTTSKVVNQCGCSDVDEFNSLKDERDQLRKNVTRMQGMSRRVRDKKYIAESVKRLRVLNKQLKPYDEWHGENTKFKSLDAAFRHVIKETYGVDALRNAERLARELYDR